MLNIRVFIAKRVELWLKRRLPSQAQHTLSRRNIFILPTRFGFAYLFLVLLLFLLGTNYQNNLILLMSYVLASFFISVMLHSFYNLSGLCLQASPRHYGFATQVTTIPVTLFAKKKHFNLTFGYANRYINAQVNKKINVAQQSIYLEQCEQGSQQILLPFSCTKRGVFTLGRIKIASEYSFGLFVSWSVLDFSQQIIIYPQPKKITASQYRLSAIKPDHVAVHNSANVGAGQDDFSELKSYVLGESKARIAWKQFARGQGKYSKHYQQPQGDDIWLKLTDMPSRDIEEQLSFLCYLVLEYSQSEQAFGLALTANSSHLPDNIPSKNIAPDQGLAHKQNCLLALATYQQNYHLEP